ncbi:MAG: cation diffusion facilitator family transporter [Deltaproteobacteria bacterium]|nr:cation diffusion facilitator family transporter [Deltaproteobacteria bacterium]
MSAKGGTQTVVMAVVVNFVIAILKFLAFSVSGSGAMLAEGIHSVADTANQALLFLGIKKSERPADDTHPFGYGAERYFWALVSAMGIFVLGCGVTVYHGVHQLMHPVLPTVGALTWGVLGVSALLEGSVFLMALREANSQREGKSWIAFLKSSSDPTLIAVLLEDSIAVIGIGIASLGILLSSATGIPQFDGAASILIGLLLGALALLLAVKNKNLLVGISAPKDVEDTIQKLVSGHPSVEKLLSMRTRVLGSGNVQLDLQVDFSPDAIVDRMQEDIHKAYENIENKEEFEAFCRSFGRDLVDELALEVDRLEQAIRKEVPQAQIIDVEGD